MLTVSAGSLVVKATGRQSRLSIDKGQNRTEYIIGAFSILNY